MASSYSSWTLTALPTSFELPPLPEIRDPVIKRTACTHKSYFAIPRRAALEIPSMYRNYEGLEYQGDAIIGCLVTAMIVEIYPNLLPGPATVIKGQLVSNEILSQLSDLYKLPCNIIADRAALSTIREQTSVKAALFEAYVGAVYQQNRVSNKMTNGQALDQLDVWLRAIFQPLVRYAREALDVRDRGEITLQVESGSQVNPDAAVVGATQRLNEYVTGRLRWACPTYHSHRLGEQIWKVTCTVRDQDKLTVYAGTGIRSSIKAAKNAAAWKVCREMELL